MSILAICTLGQKIEKKKSTQKKIVKSNKSKFFSHEIAFLAVLNFFPVQKLIFGPFFKLQKMEFGQKEFSEIDLFDFTSFFGLDFFNFLAHCELLYVYDRYLGVSPKGKDEPHDQDQPHCL